MPRYQRKSANRPVGEGWLAAVMSASLAATFVVICAGSANAEPAPKQPWRLHTAAGIPDWLHLDLAQQTRFAHVSGHHRTVSADDVTALSMRTLVAAGLIFGPMQAGIELQDARAYTTDSALLNTGFVNPIDVLRLYVAWRGADVLAAGDRLEVSAGRITIDLGSRRLVVRSGYRNTINAFTGVHAQWTKTGQHLARTFLVVPVGRRPRAAEAVADNEVEFDREQSGTLFWGLYYAGPAGLADARLAVFTLGLHERDGDVATRNRQLVTPGLRLYRNPTAGRVDFQLEGALQVGRSRVTTEVDDLEDLDHVAFFARAELGATIDMTWTPRLIAHYDHASGDADPEDRKNGRFDSLFGARRFDFGPVGIYGPFARSNLSSPGLRMQVSPSAGAVTAFVAHRWYWLASGRDAWTTSGMRDPTGESGRFLGQQFEGLLRWHIRPKTLSIEVGAAHFFRDGFAVDAPGGRGDASSILYTQFNGKI